MGQILYRDDEVTASRRFWSLSSRYHLRRNFDGAEIDHSINLEGELTLPSYWIFEARAEIDRGKYDDRETRGFGLYRKPGTQSLFVMVESDQRQDVFGEVEISIGSDQRAGKYLQLRGELEMKPATNISLRLDLQRGVRDREFAWVANLTGPPDGSIFAERTADEWSLTTRGSYVFSTELTLQVYFQLFFAKGKYENFQQMQGPDKFQPYAQYSRPDFNDLSFNSNVVLRWEYLPGSTAYLVWSQSRSGERGTYRSSFGESFNNTFALPVDNVLLLKVSYWLSL
jgi:hypothetical protein